MATLIAIAVVAFIIWQSQQAQRRRDAALPPPTEPAAFAPPFPDAPRVLAPSPAPAARAPWSPAPAAPVATPDATPASYAFASRTPHRVDRTARIAEMARGKGLCSPRQPPS